jgi:hypothetical protein
MSPAKVKDVWGSWRNKPYASRSDETEKRAALWQAFCEFVRAGRGWITTPPGSRIATLETEVGSPLPAELADRGYQLVARGRVTRVTGAPSIDLRTERLFGGFCRARGIRRRTAMGRAADEEALSHAEPPR